MRINHKADIRGRGGPSYLQWAPEWNENVQYVCHGRFLIRDDIPVELKRD